MTRSATYPSRAYLVGYVALVLICPTNELHAAIHKCVSNGGIEYSDTHCSVGILVKHTPGYRTIGTIEGLSPPELEQLEALEQAYRKSRLASEQQRIAQKKLLQRERAREKQYRARACASAIQGLERIRSIKRKGYSTKQSRTLDTRQDHLEEQKRSNC